MSKQRQTADAARAALKRFRKSLEDLLNQGSELQRSDVESYFADMQAVMHDYQHHSPSTKLSKLRVLWGQFLHHFRHSPGFEFSELLYDMHEQVVAQLALPTDNTAEEPAAAYPKILDTGLSRQQLVIFKHLLWHETAKFDELMNLEGAFRDSFPSDEAISIAIRRLEERLEHLQIREYLFDIRNRNVAMTRRQK